MVKLRVNKDYNAGGRVELAFVLTKHVRDLSLIKCLADYFGCGQFYSYKDYAEFKCRTFKDIYEKILPFFLNILSLVLNPKISKIELRLQRLLILRLILLRKDLNKFNRLRLE